MLPKEDVQRLIEESKREAEKKALVVQESHISFKKIKNAMKKMLGREEK